MRPVVGPGVQMLNPARHKLDIWKPAQDALAAGEAAVQTRNAARALKELAVGRASYVKASEQLTAFRNGTELAGRRAQVLIGVTATLAALAAVAAYSATGVAATGAAATAGAGATTGAGAGTQVRVRVAADAFREGVTRIATADTVEMFDLGVQQCTEAAPRELMRVVGR
jgi:hypothetical protein